MGLGNDARPRICVCVGCRKFKLRSFLPSINGSFIFGNACWRYRKEILKEWFNWKMVLLWEAVSWLARCHLTVRGEMWLSSIHSPIFSKSSSCLSSTSSIRPKLNLFSSWTVQDFGWVAKIVTHAQPTIASAIMPPPRVHEVNDPGLLSTTQHLPSVHRLEVASILKFDSLIMPTFKIQIDWHLCANYWKLWANMERILLVACAVLPNERAYAENHRTQNLSMLVSIATRNLSIAWYEKTFYL